MSYCTARSTAPIRAGGCTSACASGRYRTSPSDAILNLRVAWEHQEAPIEAFVYFLDELGLASGDFVVANPESLPAQIDDWFPFMSASELRAFGALAVFRYRRQGQPITQ